MKNLIHKAVLAGAAFLAASSAFATDVRPRPAEFTAGDRFAPSPAGDLQQLRRDIGSARKQAIAQNMRLTELEAERFWPIYDQFAAEFMTVVDRKLALLKEYAQHYDTLTDLQAERYLAEAVAIEDAAAALRARYIPVFRKVLSGKSTALFFQIEQRITLMVELDLASQIPVIEP